MENIEKNCCICGSTVTLLQVQDKWICEECIHIGNEKITALWKDSLEKLIKEYSEACQKCLSSDELEDVHKARVSGRKILSVLQFAGLPKEHALLLPLRKMNRMLRKIGEANMLLDIIEEQNEENNINAEMVKLLTIKQKKASEQLAKNLPKFINDTYLTKVMTFLSEELHSYILPLVKENALHQYEERFNQLVAAYEQLAEVKGKTSAAAIKSLHKIRKNAKSLNDICHYLNEVFEGQYREKETYYKDIRHQIGKVVDTKDWISQFKAFEKKFDASKKERNAVINRLKERMELLTDNIEFHPVLVTEG